MNREKRSKYADYIAKCFRGAEEETGMRWPNDTVLVVKSYSELAVLDEIIGLKILVTDMPSQLDFCVAFPSENEDCYKLLKVFRENVECFDLEFNC